MQPNDWSPRTASGTNGGVKPLLVVLSAAVIAGLGTYAAFAACKAFTLLNGLVTMQVDVLVAFIACLAIAAAAVALLLRLALVRTDRKAFDELEQRVAQLETRGQA